MPYARKEDRRARDKRCRDEDTVAEEDVQREAQGRDKRKREGEERAAEGRREYTEERDGGISEGMEGNEQVAFSRVRQELQDEAQGGNKRKAKGEIQGRSRRQDNKGIQS